MKHFARIVFATTSKNMRREAALFFIDALMANFTRDKQTFLKSTERDCTIFFDGINYTIVESIAEEIKLCHCFT